MTHQQRYDDGAAWRLKFAVERGFTDFAAVIQYGIVAAWKLPVKDQRPAQAKEILP
jgi:hypothetical protein